MGSNSPAGDPSPDGKGILTLSRLCRLYGVQTGYRDMAGRLRRAHPDALLKVLAALGAPVRRMRDVPQAVRFRQGELSRRRGRFTKGQFSDDEVSPNEASPSSSRSWGIFLPLHALYSGRSRGVGDWTDLAELARWVGRQGGRWLGTLPLLPTYLDRPLDPSPYAPVSRLFWGEFWLDLARIPEWKRCPSARRAAPAGVEGHFVDYRGLMKRKRAALEAMGRLFFSGRGNRQSRFGAFLKQNPRVEDYAAFRARQEGTDSVGYHSYAQWAASEQMEELVRTAKRSGVRLVMDLPLGVHPAGYDAWAYRDLFAQGMTVGAPPDTFFTEGQDWGFAPLHPEAIRKEGYRYWADCLRHQMRAAGLLRIDHVMGLHRLFWIPAGLPASMGVYVRYPAEELYAVIGRESRRYRCEVVGEDLGTVPPEVRKGMGRHGLHRMFILQYELAPNPARPYRSPPVRSVAGLNTHDMAPFESFWRSSRRLGKGLAAFLYKEGWIRARRPSGRQALEGALQALAAGPARVLMISLEDLWSERCPQNVPGTVSRLNWRRRARYSLEQFSRMKRVLETVRKIDPLRNVC